MATSKSDKSSSERNFKVDYVLLYSFKNADQAKAARQFTYLIHELSNVGLETAVRRASETSLFVFVKAPEKKLYSAVHKARVKDWLYGVRHTQPKVENGDPEHPETEAEHLRAVYDMLTLPKRKGGAEITPNYGDWECVESIFALHDNDLNKQWLKDWSRKTFLSDQDLDQIRARLGEKVAFYFSFLQAYFAFLWLPASFGFACWALIGQYSVVFSIVNSLSCLIFVEYWKRQEVDLALRWHVRGVSTILSKRRDFKPEKETEDPVTGARIKVFPTRKRLMRQLLQVPFSLVSILALGILIAACNSIEIFIRDIYFGPFKSILVFVPTILLSLLVPSISKVLTNFAIRLNEYENYDTEEAYDTALTRKIFVLNFVTSYLPALLSAFVYMPFSHILVPYLDVLHWFVSPLTKANKPATSNATINKGRLRGQVVYFAVTGQVVNFFLETVVPYVQRKVQRKSQEKSEEKKTRDGQKGGNQTSTEGTADAPTECDFLTRVRNESELTEYDVTADLREMCIQFGHLSLFSPVWSLVPVFFLLNNWVELRSDFVKICIECKRPNPSRADTIGPWLDSMGFLSWLGSITSAALLYLYGGSDTTVAADEGVARDPNVKGWVLLLIIFFAEHGYLLARDAVRFAMSKLDTPATRLEQGQRYMLRRRYLEASMEAEQQHSQSQNKEQKTQSEHKEGAQEEGGDQNEPERVSRSSLEEDARKLSSHSSTQADMFWARQRGWKEAAQVGVSIIQEMNQTKPEEKKAQ